MKTVRKFFPVKKVKEIFSEEEKRSGFNMIKSYYDVVRKMFSFFHRNTEGSFTRTIRVITEYLSSLEDSDFHLKNNDLHIKFKLELMKTDTLPLFPEYSVQEIDTHFKDYQYVRLILRNLGQLFLNLSEQAVLFPGLKGFRTFLHLERVYIEKMAYSIEMMNKKSEFEYDDIIDYFSSFTTLSSYFSAMLSGKSFHGKTIMILNKIENRNSDLNILIQEKFNIKYTASEWDMSNNYITKISQPPLYV